MKKQRKIPNALEAWWFIYYHPKLNVQERSEVTPEEADELEAKGYLITRDTGGKCYRIWRHQWCHAIDQNLDIFYTKTDKPKGQGTINEDKSKNQHIECWLETGAIYYGYAASGGKKPMAEWDTSTCLQKSHDYRLDSGGVTFDEALISMAKAVLKHYGDYSDKLSNPHSKRWCGKPVCGDCENSELFPSSPCDCPLKEKQVCD